MINFEEENKTLIQSLAAIRVLKTPRIIEAFLKVPRHLFVPKEHLQYAYRDIALPSLGDQTISQPYTVATMLEALSPDVGDNVLDIGSGTGWTTCLLAKIVSRKGKVTGIDIESKLVEFARKNIAKTKLKNIELVCGDGKKGYPPNAPYDCVLINAACDSVPELVIDQTKLGGRIIAPINSGFHQTMTLFQKIGDNELTRINLGSYVFVKLK
ncbi:MAG: protein-L-isoaspartate O-methyltransferase [Candidatus Aenigmarchaeota archaeon]|nr:protein-L-isoaspartate O-methyltransferase [Candidatus Aenigmarchaeota archaeon]